MDENKKEMYFVAVKVFLEKDGKFLICKDDFGDWDLPGGRIKKNEFETSLEDVVKRKLSEELGDNIEYILGEPIVYMRHERKEVTPLGDTAKIFALGYVAKFLGGDIKLSPRHTEMFWVETENFKPEDYFTGGWLKGVQEYLKIKNN
ncbi:MAG: NUDIX domain-containing protein [Patescibacteria group bacterium]